MAPVKRVDREEKNEVDGFEPLPDLFSEEQWAQVIARLDLTTRQEQVARLICRGLSDERIARELGRSQSDIRGHCERLFRRLGVNSRVGVVVRIVLAERGR